MAPANSQWVSKQMRCNLAGPAGWKHLHRATWCSVFIEFRTFLGRMKKLRQDFFGSNALIALARSLCKCLLAVLIIASGANTVKGYLVRCARIDDTIP